MEAVAMSHYNQSSEQRFVRAVRRGVLDVTASLAEADEVVVLADFDGLTRDAL